MKNELRRAFTDIVVPLSCFLGTMLAFIMLLALFTALLIKIVAPAGV